MTKLRLGKMQLTDAVIAAGSIRMKIGFIGLGIMGSRMAANLQKHGYSLVMFNRLASKQSRCSAPAEHFLILRQNSPNKWTCCSQCWLIRTRSNKRR